MIQSKKSLSIVAFAAIVLMTITAASALQVNETIGDFRISFDAPNGTNTIVKMWGGQETHGLGQFPGTGLDDASKYYALAAGNTSSPSKATEGCFVFVFADPINVSRNLTKAILIGNTSGMNIETTDRIIDGHNATVAEIHNNTAGSGLRFTAFYWIDEVDGMATKGVEILSGYSWDEGTEALLNTIHVKKEPPQAI